MLISSRTRPTASSNDTLERSHVVANCRMNRERNLNGSNGYSKEIGFNPVDFVRERITPGRKAAWIDLCCGTGKALLQAAQIIHDYGLAEKIEIVGVDLAGMFHVPYQDQASIANSAATHAHFRSSTYIK